MKRSLQQNRYYHGVVIPRALEYYREHPIDMFRDIKEALKADLTPEFVHELFKLLFIKGGSTRKLETAEMEEYHLAIRGHFARNYAWDIPTPGDDTIDHREFIE